MTGDQPQKNGGNEQAIRKTINWQGILLGNWTVPEMI